MHTRNAQAALAAAAAPAVPTPETRAQATALVEEVNRGVNDLRQRAEERATQHNADMDSIRGELATHAQRMADIQDALTRFSRPAQPAPDRTAQNEERLAAFGHWLRTGNSERLAAITVATLADNQRMSAWQPGLSTRAQTGLTSNGPYGGFVILPNVSQEIDRIRAVYSNLRAYARVQTISQGDRWNERTRIAGATAARTSEHAPRTKTDALKWAVNEIVVHEAFAEPSYSRQALTDPFLQMEPEIFAQLGEAYGMLNSVEHVSGTGVGEPQGFMAVPKAAQTGVTEVAYGSLGFVKTGHATNWAAAAGDEFDVFTNVRTALKPEYLANAAYYMNRVTLGEIMLFKDANDLPIWQPSLQAGQPSSIRGYEVRTIEHMESRAADAFPVAFGDMRQYYTIVDRVGMDMLVNPFRESGFVTFETWMRDGAKVMKSEAMKAIKVSA